MIFMNFMEQGTSDDSNFIIFFINVVVYIDWHRWIWNHGEKEKYNEPDYESKESAESLKNQMMPLKDSCFIKDGPWMDK